MSRYPYDRFVYFAPTRGFVARLQSAWLSTQHSVSNGILQFRTRLSSWWHRGKHQPLAAFDPRTGQPVLAGIPDGANFCRTRHGRATILWSLYGSGGTCHFCQAQNVLIATGKRIEATQPRRPDDSGDGWIWGRFEITAGDIALIDDPRAKPKYDPDADPEATPQEKLLATSPRFRAAVVDPNCARVAYLLLSQLEWFNVGDRDELPALSSSIAAMIAGMRDRGEIYTDYKFGATTVGIPAADIRRYTREIHDIMGELGWRTHTAEELQLRARADFGSRVDERIANWNSLTEFEARAADSYEPTSGRYAEIPMLIYQGEETWAEQLPPDTKHMMSEEYARRVRHLVATNRISHDEYRTLTGLTW
ncbi:hypothetical protein JQ607_10870 [Bradyrhizobium liaoningense]|uniref:hypothetical protein n=1 Tax=Bradyrhizobium liaoningense TaxID=43992 RepID=UPI001BA75476|nr:hypothetical protein [Bradyrhizobium liaoningense]MBR0840690.1 hypothetical protein [Bradyrhizobium liaoningense]